MKARRGQALWGSPRPGPVRSRRVDTDRGPGQHGTQSRQPGVSLAIVSAAAASLPPQALPAVIEKPSISGCSGLSDESFSRVVSRRGCSSVSNRPCGGVDRDDLLGLKRPRRSRRSRCGVSAAPRHPSPSRLTPARTAAFQPTVMDMSMFGASGRSGCVGGNQSTNSSPARRLNRGELDAEFTPRRSPTGPSRPGCSRPRPAPLRVRRRSAGWWPARAPRSVRR